VVLCQAATSGATSDPWMAAPSYFPIEQVRQHARNCGLPDRAYKIVMRTYNYGACANWYSCICPGEYSADSGTPEKRKVAGSTPALATHHPLTFSQVSGFFVILVRSLMIR
jgi:hypothetical protein